MQEIAAQEILYKLNTPDVGFTYACINNYNNIFNTFEYTNYRKNYIKYREFYTELHGGSKKNNKDNNKDIHLPPPMPVNILKQKITYEDESQTKIFEMIYNKIIYKFYTYHDLESVYYRLFRQDNKIENEKACLYIIINKNNHMCAIQNILYQPQCLPLALMNDKNGKTLLKLAFRLIDTIKNKYKIKYIQLSDHSVKNCACESSSSSSSIDKYQRNKEIKLHKMLTLLTGTTWYGKYGFTPIDKKLQKDFENNKKIIEKTYLKDVPQLKEYIIKSHKKTKSHKDLNNLLENYNRALEQNSKLNVYLQYFMKNYDRNCIIFYYFYEILYDDLRLTNMGNQSFIKKI